MLNKCCCTRYIAKVNSRVGMPSTCGEDRRLELRERGMKNQVAKPWQVWICLLPFHSKSVSGLTKLTNQSRAESVTPQTRSWIDSSGLSAPRQTCLTLTGSVKRAPWHGLKAGLGRQQTTHRSTAYAVHFKPQVIWATGVPPSCVCPNAWADFPIPPSLPSFLPVPSQAHSWNTVL